MKTFNNSDLFTGYLKQLLHTFNLPKIKVYTKQHKNYLEKYGEESPEILGTVEATPDNKVKTNFTEEELQILHKNVRYFPYLKDGEIQEYVNNKWQNVRENDMGVALVSGFSPNTIKMIMSNKLDPYECLLEQLNTERYQAVEDAIKGIL